MSESEYEEDSIIECKECHFKYHIDDGLPDCEWCDHNNSEQFSCPKCSSRANEFGQILCTICFYIGYSGKDKEIFYCNYCNCFIAEYDCPNAKEDDKNLHIIESDEDKVDKIAREKYPVIKKYY